MRKAEMTQLVMGDTIEKVSKSSILRKVLILSILAKSIGNSIPLEPAMFLSVFLTNRLILHEGNRLKAKNIDMMLFLKALCNEFFDGEIFALRYRVLCTGSKDANRFPKLQVALFL